VAQGGKKRTVATIVALAWMAVATWTGGASLLAADAAPHAAGLRCEHRVDPEGIDQARPRLGWVMESDEPGQRQTAYRILVASTRERLARDEGDLWDSGRVESSQTVDVPYAGAVIEPHGDGFWKVKIWDRHGRESPWSDRAHWSVGLPAHDDWRGEWIGWEEEIPQRFVDDTNWIWFPDDGPAESLPPGTRFFRRSFEIAADRAVVNIVLRITADDACTIFMDGREIGTRAGGHATKEMDLTYRLGPGRHVLAVMVTNGGDANGPAGLIARLQVDYAEGDPLVVRADATWKAAREESPGWQGMAFDDAGWKAARVLGPVGMPPWGAVRRAEERRLPARYLRREFTVEKPVRRAIVSLCGQGLSELHLNGRRVSDHVLSPALAEYPKRLWYVTHDVTGLVHEGRNAIGTILGNGRFFAPRSSVYASMPTYGLPKLLLQLRIEHPDGTATTILSDDAWRLTRDGPIRANNEYDGEDYDARLDLGHWAQAGYDDGCWQPVQRVPAPVGRLSAQMIEPIRVVERRRPIAVTPLPSGAWVFDIGQNIVGWCRLCVSGTAGTRIVLRHAERLRPDGTLDLANLRGARATDRYTLAGTGTESWEPRFTEHGFRYVEVTGFPGTPSFDSLEGCVVHDDLVPAGTIRTSNPLLDQIVRNAVWGFRGNYRSVPTDCPQRDERQAWLGDRLQVSRGESYVYDTQAFYAKWLQDIDDCQRDDGVIPDVCPAHWPTFTDNVVWPSAAILVANTQLRQFGDRDVVARHYPCFRRWIDHMEGFVSDGLIARDTYGDWCVPPEDPVLIHSQDPSRRTNPTLLATAFLCHDLRIMAGFAALLQKDGDAAEFRRRADAMQASFQRAFYQPGVGYFDNGTQTSCVLPLAFGMVPRGDVPRVARRLVEQIEGPCRGHIGTGLVGGQFLAQTLAAIGRADLALTVASQRDYPSLGYMVEQGATTVWELWNGDTADPAMNSGNHVMLVGDLIPWLMEDIAGIAPDGPVGGFARIRMEPRFVEGLDLVEAAHRSPHGRIESRWRRTPDGMAWDVTVPANTTAIVVLPERVADRLRLDGVPASEVGVTSVEGASSLDGTAKVSFVVESGRHTMRW